MEKKINLRKFEDGSVRELIARQKKGTRRYIIYFHQDSCKAAILINQPAIHPHLAYTSMHVLVNLIQCIHCMCLVLLFAILYVEVPEKALGGIHLGTEKALGGIHLGLVGTEHRK